MTVKLTLTFPKKLNITLPRERESAPLLKVTRLIKMNSFFADTEFWG